MSTEHQQYSPENQLEVVRQYAVAHNMEIVQEYSDHGRSGLNIDRVISAKCLNERQRLGRNDTISPGRLRLVKRRIDTIQ